MTKDELVDIIKNGNTDDLCNQANKIKQRYYGDDVYLRGLIEVSSYCKNDCYYCGLQCSNKNIRRYRLTKEEILYSCDLGYNLGFRSFVLQSGEDDYYTDEIISDIINAIKSKYSDCALTLSIGEKSYKSYKMFFDAGADRYLLRHETADSTHYSKLHPKNLTLEGRKKCLYDLKEIGFQVGAGFMVGSPYQTIDNLANDLIFLEQLQPHMIGIGPFIPQKQTRFAEFPQGSLDMTLKMMALTRITLPKALLPSTTALGTIDINGRLLGLKSGGNVVMPNLSPQENRKDYALYDNKAAFGLEAAEGLDALKTNLQKSGLFANMSRGDHFDINTILN